MSKLSKLQRMISVLSVVALMAAMMVASAFPAFAAETLTETTTKGPFTCTATYLDNDHSGTLTEGDEVLDVSCVRSK